MQSDRDLESVCERKPDEHVNGHRAKYLLLAQSVPVEDPFEYENQQIDSESDPKAIVDYEPLQTRLCPQHPAVQGQRQTSNWAQDELVDASPSDRTGHQDHADNHNESGVREPFLI